MNEPHTIRFSPWKNLWFDSALVHEHFQKLHEADQSVRPKGSIQKEKP